MEIDRWDAQLQKGLALIIGVDHFFNIYYPVFSFFIGERSYIYKALKLFLELT
jgi:hypothetical protein